MNRSRVILRPPLPEDGREFLRAVRASRGLYASWGRPPMTPKAFRALVERGKREDTVTRLICLKGSGAIVGCITLGNIVRRLFQSGYLGYYAFKPYVGRGLMFEGLQLMIRHAFVVLKLHRVEANIQPGNARSIRLVSRCGFTREGISRRYLKIAGRWRDHERWALLKEDWQQLRGR